LEAYKILIVDDETIERKVIRHILSIQGDKSILVEEAENGIDAVEQAKVFQPDVIIMDIQMPGLNGLEAISRIKAMMPQVSIVILTAHNDFDYAVQALKMGVDDYVLKPVRKQKIHDAVHNILGKKRISSSPYLGLKADTLQHIETLFPYVEETLVSCIVMGIGANKDAEQIAQVIFPQGSQFLLLIVTITNTINGDKFVVPFLKKNMRDITLVGATIGNQTVMILQRTQTVPPASDWRKIVYEQIAALLDQYIEKTGNRYTFKLSMAADDYGKLSYLYRTLIDSGSERTQNISDFVNISIPEKEIAMKIVTLDEKGAMNIFEQILAPYKNGPMTGLDTLKKTIFSACIVIEHYLGKTMRDISRDDTPDFNDAHDFAAVIHALESYVHARVEDCMQKMSGRINHLIRDVLNDIKNNFHDGFYSLNSAAVNLGLSPTYLSKIFKNHLGKNFTEYLSEMRIDEAKQMLQNTDIDITRIAELGGFNSPNYFCKVFKSFTGLSPSAYRQIRK
jgi:two-component system response regulator YesN